MVTLSVGSVASSLADARGSLVTYAMAAKLGITYFKVTHIKFTRGVMKGATVCR